MHSWLSSASSNFFLSLQGVQQPCEDPLVDSSSNHRTQRVLFSCACMHTESNALLVEYLLTEHSLVLHSSVHLLALAQCPPSRALRIVSDFGSSLNSQQISSQCTTMHMLNAHLAELHRTPQSFCLQLCLSYIALPPSYSTTLRSSLNC
jgi:hypothetical protein